MNISVLSFCLRLVFYISACIYTYIHAHPCTCMSMYHLYDYHVFIQVGYRVTDMTILISLLSFICFPSNRQVSIQHHFWESGPSPHGMRAEFNLEWERTWWFLGWCGSHSGHPEQHLDLSLIGWQAEQLGLEVLQGTQHQGRLGCQVSV